MRVLILAQERNHRGALAVSRALAKAGYLVGVGSANPTNIVAASRATHRWHSIPAPTDDLSRRQGSASLDSGVVGGAPSPADCDFAGA
jgi:hypothetical protein